MTGDSLPRASVRPGEVLAGKYRVERVLGTGGMGTVVLAHHLQLDERVAIKFLLPHATGNPEAVTRFIREARAAVKIKSEHVARVSDVGTLEDGAPYMVMEYLEGGDLKAWLDQRGALPIEQAVDFVVQACVAVADAHALGIVHRDLKPANLFCVRRSDGQLAIKVLDFGVSKLTGAAGMDAAASMTKTTGLVGSPLYMSPEQMQSAKKVDSRTDLWALGVVLFELVAGRAPFVADSIMELAVKIATEPPASLRTIRPDVPAQLDAVILRCLEKDPGKRYGNVGELAAALLSFAPAHARASVERVAGIVQASRLSRGAPDSAPSARIAVTQEVTLEPFGQATGHATKGGAARTRPVLRAALIGVATVVIAGGGTWTLYGKLAGRSASRDRDPTSRAGTSATATASAGAIEAPEPAPSAAGPTALAALAERETTDARATATDVAEAAAPDVDPLWSDGGRPSAQGPKPGASPGAAPATETAAPMAKAPRTPPATPTLPRSASPTCSVTTSYDGEGQPHFKKVCK